MPKFNIAQVAVTHTCYYEPSVYLEHCEAIGVEPSEEEYLDFIQDEIDEDFPSFDHHTVEVIYHAAD
jgi:hypothetical protein